MAKERFQKLQVVIDGIMDGEETKKARDDMSRYLKMFKGEWWNEKKLSDGDTKVAMNYVFSTVSTIAPLLTDNRPQWSVRARKPFLQPIIEGWKLASEYLWDKLDMDLTVFRWVLDALLMKIGIVEVAFDPEVEAGGELRVDVIDPRTFFVAPGYTDIWKAPMCGTREKMALSEIRYRYPKNGKKVKPDDPDPKTDYDDKEDFELQSEFATVYKVWLRDDETEDYFIDEFGKEIDEPGFLKKITGKATKEKRKKFPYGKLWVFTDKVDLEQKKYEYKHAKPPYVALYDYIIPHEFYGQGEAEQIEHMNKSFNRALQLMDHWVQFYCHPPVLLDGNSGIEKDKAEKALLEGGGVLVYNAMSNPDPLKWAQTPQANPMVNQLPSGLAKLIEEETGVTDISKGMTNKTERQSATEISTLMESSYTRTRQRVRNLEAAIKRLYYLILELMQQYYTEPRDYNYKSPDLSGSQTWDTISNTREIAAAHVWPEQRENPQETRGNMGDTELEKDEQGEKDYQAFMEYISDLGDTDPVYAAFDIEIQTNSTLPMDKQSLANLFIRLLEMAGTNPVTGMPMWKAVLENLRIPKYQEIIEQMQELFDKQNQPQMPGAPAGGPQ
jgi:hypothetical protein